VIWALLRAIPVGQTRTYGEVARELGSAARAVGQACRANPCPIVVPCHRVVGRHGLGGFAGDHQGSRLAIKRWLLHHEGCFPVFNADDSTRADSAMLKTGWTTEH
jgi:methylated-DNA-[protein]-cysteine S-methyltransferase